MGYHSAGYAASFGSIGAGSRAELSSGKRCFARQLLWILLFVEKGEGARRARVFLLSTGGDKQPVLEPADSRHDTCVGPLDLAWRVGCYRHGEECESAEGVR